MSKTVEKKESKKHGGVRPKSQFNRFVQIGRVCLINYGPYEGKLCVILDVIDANRALISGPTSGVPRHALNFKRMALTDFRVKINRGARNKVVTKAIETGKIIEKWEQTSVAKKISTRTKRANLNDFERFKVMILKQKRNRVIREATRKLLRGDKKSYSKNKLARYHKFMQKCKDKKETTKRQKVVEKPPEPQPKPKAEPKGKGKPETKKPAAKGTPPPKQEPVPAETKPAPAETKPTEKKPAPTQKKGGPAEKKPAAKGTPPPKQESEPAEKKPAAKGTPPPKQETEPAVEPEKKPSGKQPAKTGKPAPKTAEKPAAKGTPPPKQEPEPTEEKTEAETKPTEKKAPQKKTAVPKSPPPKQQPAEKKPK